MLVTIMTSTVVVAEPIVVSARAIPLDQKDAARRSAGSLRYLGGLWLTSSHAAFGGFSALGVSVSGARLVALTDQGYRLELTPTYDQSGYLVGITDPEMSPMADTDGAVFASKFARDMESLAPGANGEIIVSFERQHRLLIYTPGDARPISMPPPRGLAQAPLNGGIEALTLLADGRLLALAEALGGEGERVGWVSNKNGWSPLTYEVSDSFDPTGATTLPDGDVLVVERFYDPASGVAARIRRVPHDQIQPGSTLSGGLVAELRPPLNVDNMEGIAIRPGRSGKAVVYLISDDNFNTPDQRTLLMMFEMEE